MRKVILLALVAVSSARGAETLQVGFGQLDVTPKVGAEKPVYLAGFGQNRLATGVRDPIMARAVVVREGTTKVALVSVDLVGLFIPSTERVRKGLPGFASVIVSSTHNHEGPDTLGLWGPNPFKSGIDPDYLKQVETRLVEVVRQAEAALKPAMARIGTLAVPELLHDSREPYVKHDELVVLAFRSPQSEATTGLVVQWNCHPETLGSRNTLTSADYVGVTVKHLADKHRCPVVYLTGTVGGLMTSLRVPIKDDKGQLLPEDSWEKTERYGRLLGQAADRALASAQPLALTPIEARRREVYLPLDNPRFAAARAMGLLDRPAFLWSGDPYKAEPAPPRGVKERLALHSEVSWLRLGELQIAAIPGEIYPELVLGKVQAPPDPGADFPEAPIEPAIYGTMKSRWRMLIGLANDEVGYILPKRQWDVKPPYCYGRKKDQYGEENSVGPETGPILCQAFRELVEGKK